MALCPENFTALARQAIASQLSLLPDPEVLAGGMQGASFVTLKKDGKLRGCIGSLVAHRPLQEDIVENARSAAFNDPRFEPVTATEFSELSIHVSVLSKPVDCPVASEEELIMKLRPGIDGVILEELGRRATFLPSVWEQLSDPVEFLGQLKQKMGRSRRGWSQNMKVALYTVDEFHEATYND